MGNMELVSIVVLIISYYIFLFWYGRKRFNEGKLEGFLEYAHSMRESIKKIKESPTSMKDLSIDQMNAANQKINEEIEKLEKQQEENIDLCLQNQK